MFAVLYKLFTNLDGLNEQVAKMRQRFVEVNAFLDSKIGTPVEDNATPAIEDRSHKNGGVRKASSK